MHSISREQFLPVSIEDAWSFFSNPHNLKKITPVYMDFQMLNKETPSKIFSGLKINYKVKPMLGIPLHWETLIEDVNEPYSFTDTQTKGPYSIWRHKHTFTKVEGGTKMEDHVEYKLPLGLFGKAIHELIIKKQLEDIFEFRSKTLLNLSIK